MRNLFNWAAARLAAAFALTLPLASMAATPTVLWNGNLGDSVTVGTGDDAVTYSITGNGNTISNGKLTINNSANNYLGAKIDLPAGVTSVSVLIKYSNLNAYTSANVALASCNVEKTSGGTINTGLRSESNGSLRLTGFYNESQNVWNMSTTPTLSSSGYYLYSYSTSGGTRGYAGTVPVALEGGSNSSLVFGGTISAVSIGGALTTNKAYPWNGVVIEEVALFINEFLDSSYVFSDLTMTDLNAAIAADGTYVSGADTVVLRDVAPSSATQTYLGGNDWNGTVLFDAETLENFNVTGYGKSITLKDCSGYLGKDYNSASTYVSLTVKGTFKQTNGWSYDSQRVLLAAIKGDGTLQEDYSGISSDPTQLFEVGTLADFKGTFNFPHCRVKSNNDAVLDKAQTISALTVAKTLTVKDGGSLTGNLVASNIVVQTAATVAGGSLLVPVTGTASVSGSVTVNGAAVDNVVCVAGRGIYQPLAYITEATSGGGNEYYETVSNAIVAASASNKVVYLMGSPDATDTYAISVGETVRVQKNGYVFDGIVFPQGAEFNNQTNVYGGITVYSCALYTAVITKPDSTQEASSTPIATLLQGIYTDYASYGAGTTIRVLDNTSEIQHIAYDYNSETHTYTLKAMVATSTDGVSTTYYPSLAYAVQTVASGTTITLIADDNVSFSASNLEIGINKALTIDGGGFTIYGVNDYAYDGEHDHDIYISGSGDVTIKNVTLSGFGGAAKVNLRTYPIWVGLGYTGTLTLDGVTVTDFNRTAFNFNGGTVVVTNSTITGSTAAREGQVGYFQSGINIRDADVTIADTTITSVGSTFQQEDSDIASAVQLDNNGAGTATISGGTYSGEYGVIVASNANGTVSISGGTFTGNLLVEEGEGSGSIAVSGGTFDAAVPEEYCAEGYEPTVDGDGHYTVRIDMGWIYEADGYKGYTGNWSNDVDYVNGKAHIEDGNTYTANRPSDGRMVTVEMTLSFDDVNDEDEVVGDAKAAVKLATGGFKVYTSDGPDGAVTSVWKSVAIDGLDLLPQANQDYTFLFVLDLTNTTYTAALITDDGAATNALVLTDGSVTNIPFACRGNVAPVEKIEFIGAGSVTSIEGSYEDSAVVIEFVDGQVIGSVTLNADQAAWLNSQNNYEQLCGKILELTVDAFNEAYLLNLDVTSRAYDGTNVLVSTGIAFGKDAHDNDTVIVTVTLTRHGAIEVNGTEAPIIGTLKLMGGNALPASTFTELQSVEFTDADFSEGDTTTCTFLKGDAPAKFCKPIIE